MATTIIGGFITIDLLIVIIVKTDNSFHPFPPDGANTRKVWMSFRLFDETSQHVPGKY